MKMSQARRGSITPDCSNTRWSRLLISHQHADTIMDYYKKVGIPDDLRDLCQEWFESVPWIQLATKDNNTMAEKGEELLRILEENVNRKRRKIQERYPKTKMSSLMRQLREGYGGGNSAKFIQDMAQCITFEMSILGESAPNNTAVGIPGACQAMYRDWQSRCALVEEAMDSTKTKLDELDASLLNIKTKITDFERYLSKFSTANENTQQVQQEFQQKVLYIQQIFREFPRMCQLYIDEYLKKLCNNIYMLLDFWKSKQKHELVSGIPPPALSNLQEFYTRITQLLRMMGKLLNEYEQSLSNAGVTENSQNDFGACLELQRTCSTTIAELFEVLVRRSFLFEQLPRTESRSTPSGNIRSTNAKFSAVVRCLIGPELLGEANLPQVRLYLLREDAIQHMSPEKQKPHKAEVLTKYLAGEVGPHGSKTMEIQDMGTNGKCARATLTGLQLRDRGGRGPFKRPTAAGSQDVWEQRFAIMARCTIYLGTTTYCDTIAYPVVITVQSSQDADALATLFWDAAFSKHIEPGISPHWKNQATWGELAQHLSDYMFRETGRGLSKRDLQFLGQKFVTHRSDEEEEVKDDEVLNWTWFNKEKVTVQNRPQKFSAWRWFLGITYLVRTSLQNDWYKGNVVGFINKTDAIQMLLRSSGSAPTTIILRFAETKQQTKQSSAICGLCSFSYVHRDESKGTQMDHYLLKPAQVADIPKYIRNTRICGKPIDQVICVDKNGATITRPLAEAFPEPTQATDKCDEYDGYRHDSLHLITSQTDTVDGDPQSVPSTIHLDEEVDPVICIGDVLNSISQPGQGSSSVEIPQDGTRITEMCQEIADFRDIHDLIMNEHMESASAEEDIDMNGSEMGIVDPILPTAISPAANPLAAQQTTAAQNAVQQNAVQHAFSPASEALSPGSQLSNNPYSPEAKASFTPGAPQTSNINFNSSTAQTIQPLDTVDIKMSPASVTDDMQQFPPVQQTNEPFSFQSSTNQALPYNQMGFQSPGGFGMNIQPSGLQPNIMPQTSMVQTSIAQHFVPVQGASSVSSHQYVHTNQSVNSMAGHVPSADQRYAEVLPNSLQQSMEEMRRRMDATQVSGGMMTQQ